MGAAFDACRALGYLVVLTSKRTNARSRLIRLVNRSVRNGRYLLAMQGSHALINFVSLLVVCHGAAVSHSSMNNSPHADGYTGPRLLAYVDSG